MAGCTHASELQLAFSVLSIIFQREPDIPNGLARNYYKSAEYLETNSTLADCHVCRCAVLFMKQSLSVLQNEKYCGDALMQKTYTKDFKSHKSVKNTKLNMYFKENHHAAIIDKKDWLKVQEILTLRRDVGRVVTLRRIVNRFVAPRVKDGLFKGFYIFDSRWTAAERREFIKIINELTNNSTTKGENENELRFFRFKL